jgi:release factor glutamine methyltransferase
VTSLRAAVVAARDRLRAAGIDDAQIEAEILLRYALEIGAELKTGASDAVSRADLYSRFEDTLPEAVAEAFEGFLARRLAHEPSAYITGRREFWGLQLRVTPAVLIPRPETELLVQAVLQEVSGLPYTARLRVADVGTGSGGVAIALAKELPRAEVYAIDASREALAVAGGNASRHGLARRIAFRPGDLLTPLWDYVECIAANLPYVTTRDWQRLEPELREHEPRLALDGGKDGLDLIHGVLRQAPRYLAPRGFVALEIGDGQAAALGRFVEASWLGAAWRVERDLAGFERVFVVRAPT